jgi:hypothetical protein
MFLILYTKCARKLLYVLQYAANQKCLRTTGLASRYTDWEPQIQRTNSGVCHVKSSYIFVETELPLIAVPVRSVL